MVAGYTLADGEALQAAHPDTFWMPDLADRRALQDGDLVQLIFEPVGGGIGQRLWVRVIASDEAEGAYAGELDGFPVFDDLGIDCGDFVRFEPRHVIQVYERSEPDNEQRAKLAMLEALRRAKRKGDRRHA